MPCDSVRLARGWGTSWPVLHGRHLVVSLKGKMKSEK